MSTSGATVNPRITFMHFSGPVHRDLVATLCMTSVPAAVSPEAKRVAVGLSVASYMDRARASRKEGRLRSSRRAAKIVRKMVERRALLDLGYKEFIRRDQSAQEALARRRSRSPSVVDWAAAESRWDRLQDAPAFNRCAALPANATAIRQWVISELRRWVRVGRRTLNFSVEDKRLENALPRTLERLEDADAWGPP